MAHGGLLQGGDGPADLVQAPDMSVQGMALSHGQVITEVGAAGGLQGVVVRPGGVRVVAEIALVGPVVDAPLLGTLGHVVFDRQVVDPDLAADAVLGGVVDHPVLDDLGPRAWASLMRS